MFLKQKIKCLACLSASLAVLLFLFIPNAFSDSFYGRYSNDPDNPNYTWCMSGYSSGPCSEFMCDSSEGCQEYLTTNKFNNTRWCHGCIRKIPKADPKYKHSWCYPKSHEGSCQDNSCSGTEQCVNYTERAPEAGMSDSPCHYCKSTVIETNSCRLSGYWPDSSCGGKCEEGQFCEGVDVDKSSGNIVPAGSSRAQGSTMPCYQCQYHPYKPPPPMFCYPANQEGPCQDNSCTSDETCIGYSPSDPDLWMHPCHYCKPKVSTPVFACKKGDVEGPCFENSCPSGEECQWYAQPGVALYAGLICHTCVPTGSEINACDLYGYYSDSGCACKCPAGET